MMKAGSIETAYGASADEQDVHRSVGQHDTRQYGVSYAWNIPGATYRI